MSQRKGAKGPSERSPKDRTKREARGHYKTLRHTGGMRLVKGL